MRLAGVPPVEEPGLDHMSEVPPLGRGVRKSTGRREPNALAVVEPGMRIGRLARGFSALLLVASLGCGASLDGEPQVAAVPVSKPVEDAGAVDAATNGSTPFGPVRTARMDRVHAALAPAIESWHLDGVGTDCALVFDEREEWLVGCSFDAPPVGFVPTGETFLGKPVLWTGASLRLGEKVTPYEQVKLSLVGTVVTQTRADGSETPVLVLQDWDALSAKHPAFRGSPEEEWTGIAVHEAFHAHQMWHPAVRAKLKAIGAASPAVANADELGNLYATNAGFRADLDAELTALRDATSGAPDASAAKRALAAWVASSTARATSHDAEVEARLPGKKWQEAERFYVFLEGVARYVEASFLLSSHGRDSTAVTTLPGLSGAKPKYVYSLGMYLCFLLDRADPGWKTRVLDHPRLLVGVVEDLVARASP